MPLLAFELKNQLIIIKIFLINLKLPILKTKKNKKNLSVRRKNQLRPGLSKNQKSNKINKGKFSQTSTNPKSMKNKPKKVI